MEEATIACNARLKEQEEISNDVENDEDGFVTIESGGELREEMAADAGTEHNEDDKHKENNKEKKDGGQSNTKSAWEAHGEADQAIGERLYEFSRSLREAPKPTAELFMDMEEATIACNARLKEQEEIHNAVENGEDGFVTLESDGELLEEMAADSDTEHNKDDKHKENNKEKNDVGQSYTKLDWKVFFDAVEKIGKLIYEFPKSLREAQNTPETRELITGKTHDFKNYLMSTKEELQEQRLRFARLGNTLCNLIFFVLPDFDGIEGQIGAFARDNEDDFVKELEIFSKALKDESGKESIRELQKKLQTMQKDMETLMAKNKGDFNRPEEQNMRTLSLTCIAPVTLVDVYTRLSKRLFSNHYSTAMPHKLQAIEESMKETIGVINEGLEKIITSFSQVKIMLNPSVALLRYETNVKNLVENLSATKESIDVLCGNFQKTEDDVSSALDSYNEDIYKHVLDLYK